MNLRFHIQVLLHKAFRPSSKETTKQPSSLVVIQPCGRRLSSHRCLEATWHTQTPCSANWPFSTQVRRSLDTLSQHWKSLSSWIAIYLYALAGMLRISVERMDGRELSTLNSSTIQAGTLCTMPCVFESLRVEKDIWQRRVSMLPCFLSFFLGGGGGLKYTRLPLVPYVLLYVNHASYPTLWTFFLIPPHFLLGSIEVMLVRFAQLYGRATYFLLSSRRGGLIFRPS